MKTVFKTLMERIFDYSEFWSEFLARENALDEVLDSQTNLSNNYILAIHLLDNLIIKTGFKEYFYGKTKKDMCYIDWSETFPAAAKSILDFAKKIEKIKDCELNWKEILYQLDIDPLIIESTAKRFDPEDEEE